MKSIARKKGEAGWSLLEVVVSLGVLTFALSYAASSAADAFQAASWGVRQGDLADVRRYIFDHLDLIAIRDTNEVVCNSPGGGFVALQMREGAACREILPAWSPSSQPEIAGFRIRAHCKASSFPGQSELNIEYQSTSPIAFSKNQGFRPLNRLSVVLPPRHIHFWNALEATQFLRMKGAPIPAGNTTVYDRDLGTMSKLCEMAGYPILGAIPPASGIPFVTPVGNYTGRWDPVSNQWVATPVGPMGWLASNPRWRHWSSPLALKLHCSQPAQPC